MDNNMDSNVISSFSISSRPYPYNSYQTLLEFKNNRINLLELQNKYLGLINESYNSEIKHIQNKYNLVEDAYTDSKKDLNQIHVLLGKYHDIYSSLLEKNEKLKENNKELTDNNEKLKDNNKELTENNEKIKKYSKQLEDDILVLYDNNSLINSDRSILRADKTIIETNLVLLNSKLNRLESNKETLKIFIKKQEEYIETKEIFFSEEKKNLESKISDLKEDVELQASKNMCSICYTEKKNSLVLPCKHCYACHQCILKCFQENIHICSICREPIESVQNIYIQ